MTSFIKVAPQVRDRLERQAAAAHRTLGDHLLHLADLHDRQSRFAALREAIGSSTIEPSASYGDELDFWSRV